MGRLVIATNENDILARFWKTGVYEKVDPAVKAVPSAAVGEAAPVGGASDGKQATTAGGVKATHSPAMDILISSNFERLLWDLTYETNGRDVVSAGQTLTEWMAQLKSCGRFEVSREVLELARKPFLAERISDPEVGLQTRFRLLQCLMTCCDRPWRLSDATLQRYPPTSWTRTRPSG
jgi:threonine synthase